MPNGTTNNILLIIGITRCNTDTNQTKQQMTALLIAVKIIAYLFFAAILGFGMYKATIGIIAFWQALKVDLNGIDDEPHAFV